MLPRYVGIFCFIILVDLLLFASLPIGGFFVSITPLALALRYKDIPLKSLTIIILLYGYLKDVLWATDVGEYWIGYIIYACLVVGIELYRRQQPRYLQKKIADLQARPAVIIVSFIIVPYLAYLAVNYSDTAKILWLEYVVLLSLFSLLGYGLMSLLQKQIARWF